MADSMDTPTKSSRSRKRKMLSDLQMFQPIVGGSSPRAKKIKQERSDKNRKMVLGRCRKLSINLRKFLREKEELKCKLELCDLPFVVIRKIIQILPVDDIENLAKVNYFFYNWICSENKTSADIPFKEEDIRKMEKDSIIVKKPLLKLRCKDPKGVEAIAEDPSRSTYIMDLQMSLFDLSKLRELDLIPSTGKYSTKDQVRFHNVFNVMLLKTIHRNGTLSKLEKFDVLVDEHGQATINFLSYMKKLRDFGLNVLTPSNLRKLTYNYWYLPMLEHAVSASKAQFLRLNVIAETKRTLDKKILRSDHIQRIHFTGPCSFNGALLMPNLKVVEIDCGEECYRSPTLMDILFPDQLDIHAVGKCGLMAASIYDNCPSIKEFAGVPLNDINQKQHFSKWNPKVKKRFYKEYLKRCKNVTACDPMEFKEWVKINWFKNRFPPLVHIK